MKTKEEMIERYHHLYDKMKDGKNVKHMKIFGEAEKHMFKEIAAMHPDMAEDWLSKLEAVCWDNYLSEKEAMNISKHIINQDGIKGFKWDYPTFKAAMLKISKDMEDEYEYNCYALWACINSVYSDHAKSIAKDLGYKTVAETPADKMFESCHDKACEMLDDPDGGYEIREYYKEKMHNI